MRGSCCEARFGRGCGFGRTPGVGSNCASSMYSLKGVASARETACSSGACVVSISPFTKGDGGASRYRASSALSLELRLLSPNDVLMKGKETLVSVSGEPFP